MEIILSVGNIIRDKAANTRYRVIDITDSKITLCEMDIKHLNILDNNFDTLMRLISDGEIVIDPNDETDLAYDINKLSTNVRDKFENTRSAVNEIINVFRGNYSILSTKKPKPQVNYILQKYSLPRSSFWRIIAKYFQSGMKDISLIDSKIYGNSKNVEYRYTHKAGAKSKHFASSGILITDEVKEHFDEAINELRSGRCQNITACYNHMNNLHYHKIDIIDGIPTISLLPVSERPTFKQFYYYVTTKISPQEMDLIKTSAQEQRNNKRLLTSDALNNVVGPGDMVEIDACEADVSLVSTTDPNKTIGRPIVYIMIDVYTRMIIAVSVAFDNNSFLGVTNLFLNLADDKHEYCKRFGMGFDNNDMWQSNIIPRRVRVDRGSEFIGQEFSRLCTELGIEKQVVPGASGSLKGIVEQSFHQMHSKQNMHLENYGLIEKRYDSKHHKEATLNIEQYTKMVINFVLTHNQEYDANYPLTKDMISENVDPIPCVLWKYGVKKFGNPRPIANKQQYLFNLMTPVKAKLDRRGISYKKLYYLTNNDPVLNKEMFRAGRNKIPFDARMDMRDVGRIYYLRDNKLFDAPLNSNLTGNADYAGMTMKQYDEYLSSKRQMDAEGKVYNQELAAYNYSVNAALLDEAKKKSYSDYKNMRRTREIEKQTKSHKEKIYSKLDNTTIEETTINTIPETTEISKISENPKVEYTDFSEAFEDFSNM